MTRFVIACNGDATRWANHLGVPKHLAPAGGEPLLYRTVRQALVHGDEVHVMAPAGDGRYDVPGAIVHTPGPTKSEYASTRPWWSTQGRTVLLLGDVYFTDAAMATIGTQAGRRYWCFGRHGKSHHTGKPYGEIFAVSWWPGQIDIIDQHLAHCQGLLDSGQSNRPIGWLLLRSIQHTPLTKHIVSRPWFVEIDDLTDDLDHPADYDRHPSLGGDRAGV